MTTKTKRILVLFLTATLLSLLLLVSGLSNLQLNKGDAFPGGGNSAVGVQPTTDLTPAPSVSSPILGEILNLILLLIVIYVAARLILLLNLKRIAQLLLVVAVLFLIATLISYFSDGQPLHLSSESFDTTQPASDYPISPLGDPPQRVVQLVLIGFVFGAVLLAIMIWKQWPSPNTVEVQLSQQAESALNALELGKDFRDVILRCYLQMTQILQAERNIERSASMTVREFEDILEGKGFPAEPVHQLSRLFEKVRYGREKLLSEDEKTAIQSLNKMIEFCRDKRS